MKHKSASESEPILYVWSVFTQIAFEDVTHVAGRMRSRLEAHLLSHVAYST